MLRDPSVGMVFLAVSPQDLIRFIWDHFIVYPHVLVLGLTDQFLGSTYI